MKCKKIFKAAKISINFLSLEFLLTKFKWPNGGTVIFIRAFTISALVTIVYSVLLHLLDPARFFEFSLKELQIQMMESLKIYGAVFTGIYIALYSRFSSQWAYLSNLYNQIKQTEATSNVSKRVISDWKAGFIEDANELHLALKPMFAMIINGWAKDGKVRKSFIATVPDGKELFENLMKDINQRLLLK